MRRHENDPNEGKASLDHNIVSVSGHCIYYQRIRTIQEYIIKKKKNKKIKKEKKKKEKGEGKEIKEKETQWEQFALTL